MVSSRQHNGDMRYDKSGLDMSDPQEIVNKRRKIDHLEGSRAKGYGFHGISIQGSGLTHLGDNYYGNTEPTEEQRCCQTFKTSTYEDYKDRNPQRVPGTCQWVLTHHQYVQWRQSHHDGLLWISADPGCGKSVLARSLVDKDLNESGNPVTVCYFFFKDNDEQDNIATALCALLHQLFRRHPDLIQHALPAYQQNGIKLSREIREMWRILRTAVADPAAPSVVCVLDALDECRDDNKQQLIFLLQEIYQQPRDAISTNSFKMLVTSRPYDDIQRGFSAATSRWPQIRLRGEDENEQIHQEINLVIERRVEALATEFALSQASRERLQDQLLSMQHRTYLWLHLAMDEIYATFASSLYPDEVVIDTLPASVEEAYESILQKIDKRQQPQARQVLLIIAGARRPLQVEELALALGAAKAYRDDTDTLKPPNAQHLEKQIRQWCGLFIYIQHASLFLIHQTAKEFLLSTHISISNCSRLWRGSFSSIEMDLEMVKLCTEYLAKAQLDMPFRKTERGFGMSPTSETSPKLESSTTRFFEYCAENWTSHYQEHVAGLDTKLMKRVLMLYDDQSDLFRSWSSIFWGPGVLSQHILAFEGHTSILTLLFECQSLDLEAMDGEPDSGRTALYLAAAQGQLDTVSWLLDKGAEVNRVTALFGSALQAAVTEGHEQIVRLLLKNGANINAIAKNDASLLQQAAYSGNKNLVRLLLDHGAEINILQGGDYCALSMASRYGYEDIVQLLLERGADVNIRDKRHGGALEAALVAGHEHIAHLLLKSGADVNAEGGYYGSALQAIAHEGHGNAVKLLLDQGALVNMMGGFYGGALQAASYKGRLEVVKLLLNAGAAIHARGDRGTALEAASAGGHLEVVRQLLDSGADVHAVGEDGNALHAAACEGHEQVIKLLLKSGADINAHGGFHGTALQAASYGNHENAVETLLCRGADVNAQGGHYFTALQAASARCHEQIVQLLLDQGADINVQGGIYGSALGAALSWEHEGWVQQHPFQSKYHFPWKWSKDPESREVSDKMVQRLLDNGAEVNTVCGNNRSALEIAATKGSEKIMLLLLDRVAQAKLSEQGCNNTVQASIVQEYSNALQAASKRGHQKIVELLLERGAEVNCEGKHYDNALQAASSGGHEKIIQFLIDRGADVNARGWRGSALEVVSSRGNVMLVHLLLDNGADVNSRSGRGTALQAASREGHIEVVQLLLDSGAELNTRGGEYGSALGAASAKGHKHTIQLLLDKGAEVNSTEDGSYHSALHVASSEGHLEVVQLLLDNGAEVDAVVDKYDSALRAASRNCALKIVRLLLDRGANVNSEVGFEHGALSGAAQYNPEDAAERLRDWDADEIEYNMLKTTLGEDHEKIVQLLLDHGAEVESAGASQKGALQMAIERGRDGMAQLLLDKGVNLDVQDTNGQTPLIRTVIQAKHLLSRSLIQHSADISIKDRYGRTAIDWLKLLRTDNDLLEHLCNDSKSPAVTDIQELRSSIQKLLSPTPRRSTGRMYSSESRRQCKELAPVLLMLGDTENSIYAFQQMSFFDERANSHQERCNSCKYYRTQGRRFICKVCPNTVLCTTCMGNYSTRKTLPYCFNHEFIECITSPSVCASDEEVKAWLQELREKYSNDVNCE